MGGQQGSGAEVGCDPAIYKCVQLRSAVIHHFVDLVYEKENKFLANLNVRLIRCVCHFRAIMSNT